MGGSVVRLLCVLLDLGLQTRVGGLCRLPRSGSLKAGVGSVDERSVHGDDEQQGEKHTVQLRKTCL